MEQSNWTGHLKDTLCSRFVNRLFLEDFVLFLNRAYSFEAFEKIDYKIHWVYIFI